MSSESTLQRLYIIKVATHPTMGMPVLCYLIQTHDGRNILIDSGLPDNAPPEIAAGAGENVIQQLAHLNLTPADIDTVICTHFDIDHAGHHGAFAHAEFIVQRTHYDYALHQERFAFTRPQWNQPAIRYRFVEGDTELLPGLTLLETSGHTRGHQSVLVALPETGKVLLTIDAVLMAHRFTPDSDPTPMDEDGAGVRASTRKLLEVAEREQVGLVVLGHDPNQWQTLKLLPDYYG